MPINQSRQRQQMINFLSLVFFNLRIFGIFLLVAGIWLMLIDTANAHDVTAADKDLIAGMPGMQLALYAWLGAKHMVTGYDHLLFLVGVVFYLKKVSQIAYFVSLFAFGHTITLITGVLFAVDVNAYIIDAIIGLSVVYKGFDNLGGFRQLFGEAPNERVAVFVFGLFHGLGLASKLQDIGVHSESVLMNLIAFNIGVEVGQFVALIFIVLALHVFIRKQIAASLQQSINYFLNGSLIIIGFTLMAYQIARM